MTRYLKDSSVDTFIAEVRSMEEVAGMKLHMVGGALMDDKAPYRLTLVNSDGGDWESYGGKIDGIFIE